MPNNQVGFVRRRPVNNQVGLSLRNFNYGMAVGRYGPGVAWKLSKLFGKKVYERIVNGKPVLKRPRIGGGPIVPRRLRGRPFNSTRYGHKTFLGKKKVTKIASRYKLRRHK